MLARCSHEVAVPNTERGRLSPLITNERNWIMTTDPSSSRPDKGPAETTTSEVGSLPTRRGPRFTRASAAWVATSVALLLLILLIVFILQNSAKVEVRFLGMSGS